MNLVRCDKGHFYDRDSSAHCPHCEAESGDISEYSSACKEQINNTAATEAPYIFVSYSHADSEEVLGVLDFLKENHFNIWYDEGIKSGSEWADEISKRIKCCKQFVCFMSKNSSLSESVKDEIHIAWKYNINTIVVYLEKLDLDGGLEMKLDRKQAILKYKLSEQDFQKKLSSSVTPDAMNLNQNEEPNDYRLLDHYKILKVLSKGGTSSTYLAKHKSTGMQVVLKHGKYDETVSGQRIKKSFERERDILSKNFSPFVPAIYDYFYDSQNIYLVETYIEGNGLNKLLAMSLPEKIEKIIQVAKVLRHFHRNGIYHCDIKPEHIIVNQHGCFLIDFGSAEDSAALSPREVKMGTVTYAAPEQFVSYNGEYDLFGTYESVDDGCDDEHNIDARTDIYALGKTMIKILSGNCHSQKTIENPAVTETLDIAITTTLFTNVSKTIEKFSDNPLLQALIEKMVRDKKSERYNSVEDVIRVLEDFLKIYKESYRNKP